MLSYGKPFILDWAIPQKEGVPSSQVAGLKFRHNRVIVSRHGNASKIRLKELFKSRGKTLVQKKHV